MTRHSRFEGVPAGARPVGSDLFLREPAGAARDMLGCLLVVDTSDGPTGGIIVETEAYLGSNDPGSHAATRGITARNAVMYGPAGTVYVYFTYGCHYMLNIVCCAEGEAGAVLIRAIQPTVNIESMHMRRGRRRETELCNGPGKLTQALGVDLADNGSTLGVGRINVYDGVGVRPQDVGVTGRVGLSAGHELELRYHMLDNPYVSRGRTGPSGARARKR